MDISFDDVLDETPVLGEDSYRLREHFNYGDSAPLFPDSASTVRKINAARR